MKSYFVAGLLALILVTATAPVARAEVATATSSDPAAMIALMQSLMKQVELLQKQLATLQTGMKGGVKEVKEKGEKVETKKDKNKEDRVKGDKVGTTTVQSAIDAAELTIADLKEIITDTTIDRSITDKSLKKAQKALQAAEKKLADAKVKLARGNYHDALAKAVQAKRFAERGLSAIIGKLIGKAINRHDLEQLYTARNKARDAAIKQSISNIWARAELSYNGNDYSYAHVCTDPGIVALLSYATMQVEGTPYVAGAASNFTVALNSLTGPASGRTAACHANKTQYVAAAPLVTVAKFWCVDSTGTSKQIALAPVANALVCP